MEKQNFMKASLSLKFDISLRTLKHLTSEEGGASMFEGDTNRESAGSI
jgi:hypothetical protein